VGVRAYSDQSRDYLAIRRLSPLVNPPNDWQVCVVKSYLDVSYSDGLIGLAAYVSTAGQWGQLEQHWAGMLDHHRMPLGIHMRDLYQRRKEYAGKDLAQALHVAGDFVAYLAGVNEWAFRRYSCIVNAADYARAQSVCPELQNKAVHAFCVDHCTGRIFRPRFREEHDATERNIEILFDGNEEFFEHLHRVWKVEKNEPWSWAQFVVSVAEVNNADNKVIPMQAVDILAWVARRYRARGDHQEWHSALCDGDRSQLNCHDFYDYDALIAKYGAA
jgi:hypothetical protein